VILNNEENVKKVLDNDLLLFTYGSENSKIDIIEKQKKIGINAIILDQIGEVLKNIF
jgi:glycerophosphoryl diester phosphodiesterase